MKKAIPYHQSHQQYPRLMTFSLSQTVILATGAASFAAISTALLASYWMSLRVPAALGSDAFLDGSSINTFQKEGDMPARKQEPSGHSEEVKVVRGADHSTRLAWLMSFPNSGTSFTLHLTREASNCTTATNYALEGDIKDKPGVPAIPLPEGSNGPWLELIPNRTTTIPRFILTKTHCGGFCTYCPPERYVETPRSFQLSCSSGTKAVLESSSKPGELNKTKVAFDSDKMVKKAGHISNNLPLKKKPVTYDSKTLVKKAIHIYRNPLDNIVARFHLDRRRQLRGGLANHTKWPELYPSDSTGFQQWCEFLDSFVEEGLFSLRWIDQALKEALEGVPCKAEFYRYVQWHNMAANMVHEMGIPRLTLHYSDYQYHFEDTKTRILQFLELPHSSGKVEFEPGKEYSDYYSIPQKTAIQGFIEELATTSTWNELKRYRLIDLGNEGGSEIKAQKM